MNADLEAGGPVRSGESLPAQKKGMSSSHRPRPQPAQRTPGFVDDTALAVERALRALRADPEAARRDPRIVALVRTLRAPRDAVRMCKGNRPRTCERSRE